MKKIIVLFLEIQTQKKFNNHLKIHLGKIWEI